MKSIMLGGISVKDLHGPLSDFMQKLQGEEGEEYFAAFKLMLRKENPWPPKWREEDGVIYFSVTSDSTTGEDWVMQFRNQGCSLTHTPEKLLCSSSFRPTKRVIEVAVLKGMLFEAEERTIEKVRSVAKLGYGVCTPNLELACLIRQMFTDDEIRAWHLQHLVVMHEPIVDYYGSQDEPLLLSLQGIGLDVDVGTPDHKFSRRTGFVFEKWQKPF